MPYRDPEERRAYGREWMRLNPEKAREGMRRWRAGHPDTKRARAREYYVAHQEEIVRKVTAYLRAHPLVAQTIRRNRRSREIAAPGSFTTREWQALVETYGHRCAYCGADGVLVADHRVSLSRGGTNWIENILPACGRCNNRKYTQTEDEFRERLRREAGGEPFGSTGTKPPARRPSQRPR